ncbi:MAG: glycerol-3-phosphate dehydrogenase (NAD(P)+), partial [Limisphaerales bacterium]
MALNSTSKNQSNHPIGVIGAGSFGTAIANLIGENVAVKLYDRSPERAKVINRERYASGQKLLDR